MTLSVSEEPAAPKSKATVCPSMRLKRTQDHLFLSWLVAITASFLAVGVAGMFEKEDLMPILLSGTKGEKGGEKEAMQAAMVELQTEEVSAETVEETTPDVLEVPPPIEFMEQPLDLPELAEALVTEDVFVIPTPPKIEDALRPQDPAPPKPKPKPTTAPAPRRMVSRTSTSGASGAATSQGGSGGAGNTGSSNLRGTFNIPRPIYPSSLKSMGVQGTVRLSISVGSSGRAESVSVIGSSGNSTLDQFAASWVRRNGRGPAGLSGTFIAPLTFVIR